MELDDCAFPLLAGVVCTDDANRAFEGVDYGLLVGAMPRKEGMERADLLSANGAIFTTQGKAISAAAAGGSDIHQCTTVPLIPGHGPGVVITGSATVLINHMPACRMGDTILEAIGPPNVIVMGELTVIIGG